MAGENEAPGPGSNQFLRDLWYMPALAKSLAPGQMRREVLLASRWSWAGSNPAKCSPYAISARTAAFPLSAGRILADGSVECPYHGWRFKRDGACSKIPSLTGTEDLKPEQIRVRAYPVREQDGLVLGLYA